MMHIMPVPGIFKGGQRITNFFAVTMVNILEMTYKHICLTLLIRNTGFILLPKLFHQYHLQVLGSKTMPYSLSLTLKCSKRLNLQFMAG